MKDHETYCTTTKQLTPEEFNEIPLFTVYRIVYKDGTKSNLLGKFSTNLDLDSEIESFEIVVYEKEEQSKCKCGGICKKESSVEPEKTILNTIEIDGDKVDAKTLMDSIIKSGFMIVNANADKTLTEYVKLCYQRSFEAGWHTDLATGDLKERNKGEMLMLIVSEISEAMEGERKNLQDDHLPHRKMAEVELADAFIRICDYAGRWGYDLEGAVKEKLEYNLNRQDHKIENRIKDGGKSW